MIALSMVLRGRTMSLGGVFMMLSCFVMCVFCHMRVLWNRYFDSLNQDFHDRLLVSDSILPPASLAVVGTQFVSTGPFQFPSERPGPAPPEDAEARKCCISD